MRFLLCLFSALPLLAVRSESPVVDVFVARVAPPMDLAFYHAQGIASEIYSQIGVKLRWRQAGPQHPARSNGPMHCSILVTFSWNTPTSSHPAAMAFSNPYSVDGAGVTVFMDRWKSMVDHNPIAAAFLLGHVLAHETGHVLQGIARHSATGVLKERWSELEIRRMQVERLRFTDYDAALILEGIRRRTAVK